MISFRIGRPGINFFNPEKILVFLWLFLIVFPKGGVKLGGVPITWGYLILGLTFLYAISRPSWTIRAPRIEAILCLLPFQLISAATILLNGNNNLGMTLSFFISIFFLPYAFFFIFSNYIETMNIGDFFDLFRKGIAFISYYGIILFIYKHVIGKYIEIPFLTINYGDMGTLDDYKCNSRGGISKLISTYNNGQLFGISMTMLLPLYCHLQTNPWHRLAVKFALFLTLSRTTWIGLVMYEICHSILIAKNKKKAFAKLFVLLTVLCAGFVAISYLYGFGIYFLLDRNFGGRRNQLDVLQNISFFSAKPFDGFSEMVYMGMLESFGMIGLGAFILAMLGPLLFYSSRHPSTIRLCIILGLINYLFISVSDGALLYIPVLAFYWFLASLLGRRNLEREARCAISAIPGRVSRAIY